MIDTEELNQLRKAEVAAQAKARFRSTSSRAASIEGAYERYMRFYDPLNGDQWPEDRIERPGKIHDSLNIVKPAVDVASRLQSILPRIALRPANPTDPNQRAVAEALEKAHSNWLDDSGWSVWLNDTCRVKEICGKTVWKPVWDEDLNQPSVIPLEQPGKLRIGWSGSDFRKKDWTIFEYKLSPLEAMTRWSNLKVIPTKGDRPLEVISTDHTDPLNTMPEWGFSGLTPGGNQSPSLTDTFTADEYEGKQVAVWDYWYKQVVRDGRGRKTQVCNAILVEGQLVDGPNVHNEYKDIPYIVIENDHRPGSPEGISSVKAIMDLQDEFNRHFSHWAQMVADNSDPAWQLTGENADDVPPGAVPKAGFVAPTGINNRIEPVQATINQFPLQQLVTEYWNAFHKITGLSEILFGSLPGAQTSGRAVAVQIEAAANRLSPRRERVYAGLKELFSFWKHMLRTKRATVQVGNDEIRVYKLLENAGRWDIVAPEITPRDVTETITNQINLLNAKLTNIRKAADELGDDSPEDTIRGIIEERNNVDLFPGDVQVKAAVMQLLLSIQMQQQQAQAMSAAAEAQSATAGAENEQRGAQPSLTEGAGGEGLRQPASQPGTGGIGGTAQTLIRSDETGQAQGLQQIGLRNQF